LLIGYDRARRSGWRLALAAIAVLPRLAVVFVVGAFGFVCVAAVAFVVRDFIDRSP
jgi:hypothetical protein